MADLSATTLKTEVRVLLNEPTSNVFSDDMIFDWINIAARNVSAVTGAVRTTATVTLTTSEGILKHNLSGNFIKIESARFNDAAPAVENNKGLQRITPEMIGHVAEKTPTIPRFYCTWGNAKNGTDNAFVWPTSSDSEDQDTLTFTGPAMVSDYPTNLPEYLQYPCVYFALACAYCKDGKHRKAAHEMQRYMSIVMHYRRDVVDDIERIDGRETRVLPDRTIIAGQQ